MNLNRKKTAKKFLLIAKMLVAEYPFRNKMLEKAVEKHNRNKKRIVNDGSAYIVGAFDMMNNNVGLLPLVSRSDANSVVSHYKDSSDVGLIVVQKADNVIIYEREENKNWKSRRN